MTNSERRRIRKLWRMREREIEELNNPRPIIYIGDIIKNILIGTGFCTISMFLGWFFAFVAQQINLMIV